MTIDEAIKILTHMSKSTNVSSLEDCIKAIKLGIESLKWRRQMEQDYGSWVGPLLPGETEE